MKLKKGVVLIAAGLLLWSGCKSGPEEDSALAAAYLSQNDYERALKMYQSITARFPAGETPAKAMFMIGQIYQLYLKKPQEAVEAYEEFVQTYPTAAKAQSARLNLAELYEKELDKLQSAIACYQRVIEFADDKTMDQAAYSQFKIAQCYDRLGETEQAITESGILLEKYPKSRYVDNAKLLLADIDYMRGNYDAALKAYGAVAEEFPNGDLVADAKFGRAASLEELGKLDEALTEYSALLPDYREPELLKRRMARLRARLSEKKSGWRTGW